MPDISMCLREDCPVRFHCLRHEASGTRPSERRQSCMAWTWRQPGGLGAPVECDGYCPADHAPAGRAALAGHEITQEGGPDRA